MKRPLALLATTAALACSPLAQAQTDAAGQAALRALMAIDVPDKSWVNRALWDGVGHYAATAAVDGNRDSFTGNPWVPGQEALACETWAGVLCVDGAITYLEIPFAEMNGEMGRVMAALAPIRTSLRSLNLVGNARLRGPAEGLAQLTALEGLYLDNTGLAGALPDLTALRELRYAGLNDNPGLTGMDGGIGAEKLQVLHLHNTPAFAADLTAVLSRSARSLRRLNVANSGAYGQLPDYRDNTALNYLKANGSGLGGALTLADTAQIAVQHLDASGTGISAPALGLNPSVGALDGLQGAASGDTITLSWLPSSGATRYKLNWAQGQAAPSQRVIEDGQRRAELQGLTAGSYLIEVVPVADHPRVDGAEIQGSAARITVSVGAAQQQDGNASGGGGGAALWLGLLPLIAAARRAR